MSRERHVEASITAEDRCALRAIISLAIVLLIGVCQAGAAQNLSSAGEPALAAFMTRIEAYARLHQRLEMRFPPLEATADSLSRLLNRRYLAAAIRAARPNAKEGDLFTPDVADMFRSTPTSSSTSCSTRSAMQVNPG